jgi:hypothetical protein
VGLRLAGSHELIVLEAGLVDTQRAQLPQSEVAQDGMTTSQPLEVIPDIGWPEAHDPTIVPRPRRHIKAGEHDLPQDASSIARLTLKVDHGTPKAAGILPDDFVDPGDDFLELVAPEAGLDNDDPRMLGVRRDHLAGEQQEIDDVTGNDSSTFGSRQCELGAIGDLMRTEFVRADPINAFVPEQTSDLR